MLTIVQAIAQFEGFNIPHSRAQRNNNPGNINFGSFAQQFGATLETIPQGVEEKARFAYFPTTDQGWNCLRELLNSCYNGMTILAAFNKYAPSTENNTESYAEFVCRETGLSLTTVLSTENIG